MARSVIITGGFGVLGQAVSEGFNTHGYKVSRIDLAATPIKTVSGSLDIGSVDLSDGAATQAALDKIVTTQGGVDVLINVAGGFTWETLAEGSIDTWTRMQSLNLLSNVTVTKAALSELAKSGSGRIVNIGAGAALKAGMGMGAYAASKSAVHRLTEALAEEVSARGITVNAVLPSIIDTPTNRKDMPDADFSHWVQPAAIAEVIVFLASDAARSITGALIPVTRGA